MAALGAFLQGCNQPALIAAQASRDYEAAIHAESRGDKAAAFESYSKAARGQHMNAQFEVGWRYERGDGVARDDNAAIEWYVKAASLGHSTASNNIGAMIANGRVGDRDRARALAWYIRATGLGAGVAMGNIAAYYRNGYLVGRDPAKEYFWEALAVRFGYEPAKERMQRVGATLPEDKRRASDEAVRLYRVENLPALTADLRSVADIRDFAVPDRAMWTPAVTPIQFQYPVKTARSEPGGEAG